MFLMTVLTLAMPGLAPPESVTVPVTVIGKLTPPEGGKLNTCLRTGEVIAVSGGLPRLATTNLLSATGAECCPSRSTASAKARKLPPLNPTGKLKLQLVEMAPGRARVARFSVKNLLQVRVAAS